MRLDLVQKRIDQSLAPAILTPSTLLVLLALLTSLALLTACGGGGGGASGGATNTAAASSASPDPSSSLPDAVVPNPAAPPTAPPTAPPIAPPLQPLPLLSGTAPGLSTPTAPEPPSGNFAAPDLPGAFASTIEARTDGMWANAATWGGRVPVDGDLVLIPRGRTVQLAGDTARLKGLWINGALGFADADVGLTSNFVMVHGRLQAGSPAQPYVRRAVVTLTGTDNTLSVLGMGTKTIGVGPGGLLKLHGEHRLAWSQLSATANAGATTLALKDDAASWRQGDRLLIVASGFDPREAETVTVTSVSGNTVSFTPPLAYRHVGLLQTYNGKVLDQRAAVGLLSRNIVVRGDADSDINAFGGHIMVMTNGHAQVSGIELSKMGQRGAFGRYPFHWHLGGDRAGDYLVNSSIHHSFHRAVVAHSTNNLLIDSNVAYDIAGHAYVWAEDGDEVGNQLTRNVGALIRNPAPDHFAFPINNSLHGNSAQSEHRNGVFWGRNFNKHVIRNNISAGSLDGFGFFFDLFAPTTKRGDDEGGGLVFDGNIAHSTYKTLATGNQINYPEATAGHGLMVSTGTSGKHQHVFGNFTGHHNISGAWMEDRAVKLKDTVLADNGIGVLVLRAVLEGITIVGQSANPLVNPGFPASATFTFAPGIQVAGSNHGGKRAPHIQDVTIINQKGAGLLWDLDNISPSSVLNRVNVVNTPLAAVASIPHGFEFHPDSPNFGVTDFSGLFAGDGKISRVFMRDAALEDGRCTARLESLVYTCPADASLLLQSNDNLDLIEDTGTTTALRRFNYYDNSIADEGALSYVGNGRRYQVVTTSRSRYDLAVDDANGKTVELAFGAALPASRVMQAGQTVPAAASLAALRAAPASAHFFDAAGQQLFVRIVGGTGRQAISVEAPFTASATGGRPPVVLPAGAVNGYSYAAMSGSTAYQFKYGVPGGNIARSGKTTTSKLDDAASQAAVGASLRGDTTVLRGYVYAATDGFYRIGLWGNGGGTSLWIGDTFVMGEPSAFINSNFVRDGQLSDEFGVFNPNGRVALRAGWHPVTAIHAKLPDSTDGSALLLRWMPPGNTTTWVYPDIKREP